MFSLFCLGILASACHVVVGCLIVAWPKTPRLRSAFGVLSSEWKCYAPGPWCKTDSCYLCLLTLGFGFVVKRWQNFQ